jgi:alpha-D-ribose 1-methylphosphonate 5-triphosphate synthase subunit PhnL
MNNQPKIPDSVTRERSIAKMREISMMFDAQIMMLDELIAQVEAQNRQNSINVYRQKQGKRLLTSLQQEVEN